MKAFKFHVTATVFYYLLACLLLAGCQKDTETENLNPQASFTYTSARLMPVTVNFVNTSMIPAGQTATYLWDFGDGSTSNLPGAVSHSYSAQGVYPVRLTQTTSGGMQDVITYEIRIDQAGSGGSTATVPGPNFTFMIPVIPTRVTFINTSTGADSFLWTFGDGATSTTDSTTVLHDYNAAGNYNVVLKAMAQNVHDTATAIILIP